MVRINYMFIFNNALHLCIYSYFLVVLKDESRASPMLGKRSTTKPTSQPQDALCELCMARQNLLFMLKNVILVRYSGACL
jgi:hypothetical protein